MDVRCPCPECAAILTIQEEHPGKEGTCNKCGKRILLRDTRIVCPAYNQTIFVPEQRVGATVYCRKCGARIAFVLSPVGLIPKTDQQVHEEPAAVLGSREQRQRREVSIAGKAGGLAS